MESEVEGERDGGGRRGEGQGERKRESGRERMEKRGMIWMGEERRLLNKTSKKKAHKHL